MPIFYIARDPISILKHIVNYTRYVGRFKDFSPLMKRFNLTCDITKLFPTLIYQYSDDSKPTLESLYRVAQIFSHFLTLKKD